jgi:hypothetical protein
VIDMHEDHPSRGANLRSSYATPEPVARLEVVKRVAKIINQCTQVIRPKRLYTLTLCSKPWIPEVEDFPYCHGLCFLTFHL